MRGRFLVLILVLAAVLVVTGWRGSSPAPIHSVAVHMDGSNPPQYFLKVISGLPDTCRTLGRTNVERSGTEIAVSLVNYGAGAAVDCEESPWRTWRSKVALGSDFEAEVTYTVRVNQEARTFQAGLGEVETRELTAAIAEATVVVDDSDPPRYSFEVISFTPFACDTLDETTTVFRSGRKIAVALMNRLVDGGCVSALGSGFDVWMGEQGPEALGSDWSIWSGEWRSIALGSDFEPGSTYVVRVNNWETFFRADPEAFRGPVRYGLLEPPNPRREEYFARAPQPIPEQFPPLGNGESVVFPPDTGRTVVRVSGSNPPSYILETASSTVDVPPTLRRIDVRKSGDRIEFRPVGYPPRIRFYSLVHSYPYSVDLGTDFESGVTYTVYSQGRVVAQFTPE